MRNILSVITGCCVVATSTPAIAAPETLSFRFFGTVRTVCRVSMPEAGQLSENRLEFGAVQQVCNDRSGFRVILSHPAGMQGAVMIVGNDRIPLSPGTETVIIDRNRPTFRVENAELELGTAAVPAQLSFRVQPKGTVY